MLSYLHPQLHSSIFRNTIRRGVNQGLYQRMATNYTCCQLQMMQAIFVSYGMLTIGVASLTNAAATGLSCHCSDGKTCDASNGYCESGCAKGWQGPGCQVGENVAAGSSAGMTSVFCPDNEKERGNCILGPQSAVDGIVPSDRNLRHCSRSESQLNPAWTVYFSTPQVIQAVTVYSHPHIDSYPLQDFDIFITNTTRKKQADRHEYISRGVQKEVLRGKRTFSIDNVIGQSVTISGNDNAPQKLIICEVEVSGYEYRECAPGKRGPGCLLHSCDSPGCIKDGGTCTQSGDCSFTNCPENRYWPPDCWIKMPDLTTSHTSIANKKESIHVYLLPLLVVDSNLKVGTIFLEVKENWSGKVHLSREFKKSYYLEAEIPVIPQNSYTVSWTAEGCMSDVCRMGFTTSMENTQIDCLLSLAREDECLLYGCRSGICLQKGGTCTAKSYCTFPSCPGKMKWPPHCTIKMPDLSRNNISILQKGELIQTSLSPWLKNGILLNMTSVLLEVRDNSSDEDRQNFSMTTADRDAYNATLRVIRDNFYSPDKFYTLTWSPNVCIEDVCQYGPAVSRTILVPGRQTGLMVSLLLILLFVGAATFTLCKCLRRCQSSGELLDEESLSMSPSGSDTETQKSGKMTSSRPPQVKSYQKEKKVSPNSAPESVATIGTKRSKTPFYKSDRKESTVSADTDVDSMATFGDRRSRASRVTKNRRESTDTSASEFMAETENKRGKPARDTKNRKESMVAASSDAEMLGAAPNKRHLPANVKPPQNWGLAGFKSVEETLAEARYKRYPPPKIPQTQNWNEDGHEFAAETWGTAQNKRYPQANELPTQNLDAIDLESAAENLGTEKNKRSPSGSIQPTQNWNADGLKPAIET